MSSKTFEPAGPLGVLGVFAGAVLVLGVLGVVVVVVVPGTSCAFTHPEASVCVAPALFTPPECR
jgi:hypothetical protein